MQLKSDEISKIIKDQIKNYSNKTEYKERVEDSIFGHSLYGYFDSYAYHDAGYSES